jgi:hypothetical protein
MRVFLKVARIVFLVQVPLVTGWCGFAFSFSDRSPGQGMLERSVLILGTQMLGGIIIGLLSPQRWYLCILAAWGSLFWFALKPTAVFDTAIVKFSQDLIHPPWVPPSAVLLTAVAGYVASRVRITRGSRKADRVKNGET